MPNSIDQSILDLKILPGIDSDPELLKFNWTVIEIS